MEKGAKQMKEKIKVLIIDDEPAILKTMERDLLLDREQDYLIETIADPKGALAKVENFKPDVVLLDNRFGDSEAGIDEILPRIKTFHPDVAVIIITAHRGSDTEPIIRSFGWSADHFLDKPVSPVELRAHVIRVNKKRKETRT